jgi:putative PEP-CTERM system histidine kinase
MNFATSISFVAAGVCVVLAAVSLALKRVSRPWWFFSLGMVLLAADAALGGLGLAYPHSEQMLFWQKLRLMGLALLPGTWLVFSLCYSRGNYREFLKQWRMVLVFAYVVPAGAALGFSQYLIKELLYEGPAQKLFIALGPTGKVVNVFLLISSVLILVNMERTFRTAVGIMRWRIKYFVLGTSLLFGAKLYISSQALLYSGIHGVLWHVNAAAILVAGLMIAYSLVRTKLGDSEIYPSQKVLQHSVTIILAGVYLIGVGILADLTSVWGGDPAFPLKAFLLMLVVAGLGVVVLSDRVQQKIKLFVSRNFRRPAHDYRTVWSAFTERTGALLDQTELCRAVVRVISETFELLSVTVWVAGEHGKGLALGASSSLADDEIEEVALPPGEVEKLLRTLRQRTAPFDIDRCEDKSIELLKTLNPDHFGKGGNRVCVPLISAGEVVGLITVADRVNGLQFSVEDLDLLKCIGEQVAGSLRNIQLSRRLVQNKELQAFQTMSAFFVHDLKNTASTLSLMLQNLATHFGDPDFREDCLRGLSRSVGHLNDLLKRLTQLRQELDLAKIEVDLNELTAQVLGDLEGAGGLTLLKDFQPLPKVMADPEQLRKVITNLLLNAKDAVNDAGEIRVSTVRCNGSVLLSVSDNGCGMSPEFMRRLLFKPFQTTKKTGLGIGMFHSKAIVEAHQGRIEVESEPGQGTTFRVHLPTRDPAPC